jgi:transcriptional regulator with XRE-family HTH domain
MATMGFSNWLDQKYMEWMADRPRSSRSQTEFAEYLGISQSLLNKYLTGKRVPTVQTADKLAARLGPEIYDLLGFSRPDPILDRIKHLYDEIPPENRTELIKYFEEFLLSRGFTQKK